MRENNRFFALDGIKGISAIAIAFFYHYYAHFCHTDGISNLPVELPFLFKNGFLAVELFFMISGFTMYHCYHNDIVNNDLGFKNFIKKRINALLPLMITTLLIVAIEQLIYIGLEGSPFIDKNFNMFHFFSNILFLQGSFLNGYSFNLPTWFVGTLLFVYILYYIILYYEKKYNNIVSLIMYCFMIAIGWICMLMHSDYPLLGAEFAGRGYVTFFIGVVICKLYKDKKKLIKLLVIFAIVAIASVCITKLGIPGQGKLRIVLVWVIYPLLIIASVYKNTISKILKCKILRILGSLSSFIFFLHFPVQILIMIVSSILKITYISGYCLFPIYVVLVMLASYICYSIKKGKEGRINSNPM